MSGTTVGPGPGYVQNLKYTDFIGNAHSFIPKKDEIMLAYKSNSESEGFLNSLGDGADKVPDADTRDPAYSYARVDLVKPYSDGASFVKGKFPNSTYIPVLKEYGRERYFFPASFVLQVEKTSVQVIEKAESTGKVLGYDIIRKYPYKSNQLGEQVGDDEDDPLEHKSDIINNSYGYYVVRLPESPSGETTEETLFRTLRENNGNDGQQKPSDVQYAEVDSVKFNALRVTTPADTDFGSQWGLKAAPGTRTNSAWDDLDNRGHQNVVIAVLDTGLRTGHDDFKFRSGWTPATLVINAYNVLDLSTNVSHSGSDPDRFHGTWVAGVSSARVDNNDSGVAGAAWQCRVTPVKICEADTIVTSNAKAGVDYIIGKSDEYPSRRYIILAGWTVNPTADFQNAIADAYNNHNILVVAAVGDFAEDIGPNPRYPVSYNNVLRVGAHKSDGSVWASSNFGTGVLMAPGESIRTADGSADFGTVTRSGSSLAAAFVAGEAGTVWGRDRNLNGSFSRTSVAVRNIIMNSTNLDGPATGRTNAGKIRTDLAANFTS